MGNNGQPDVSTSPPCVLVNGSVTQLQTLRTACACVCKQILTDTRITLSGLYAEQSHWSLTVSLSLRLCLSHNNSTDMLICQSAVGTVIYTILQKIVYSNYLTIASSLKWRRCLFLFYFIISKNSNLSTLNSHLCIWSTSILANLSIIHHLFICKPSLPHSDDYFVFSRYL